MSLLLSHVFRNINANLHYSRAVTGKRYLFLPGVFPFASLSRKFPFGPQGPCALSPILSRPGRPSIADRGTTGHGKVNVFRTDGHEDGVAATDEDGNADRDRKRLPWRPSRGKRADRGERAVQEEKQRREKATRGE